MLLLVLFLFGEGQDLRVESGKATIYSTSNSGPHIASCNGRDPYTKKPPCRRCFFDHQSHIAHRDLPLGTTGLLCNLRSGHCTRSVVRDRGPWGAIIPCSEVTEAPKSGKRFKVRKIRWNRRCYYYQVQRHLLPGWSRRGNFDLTKPLAKAIGHRAFDMVVFIYQPKKKVALR